jgi:hypothetical protein
MGFIFFLSADLPVIVTRAHIRKWIHERDLGKLEKLLWAGHGERLLMETSASPRVRSFLESVPYVMVKYAQVQATIDDLNVCVILLERDKRGSLRHCNKQPANVASENLTPCT